MLEGELARQQRLKAQLAADAQTAAWVAEPQLLRSYKQLQFFDTLALYFNRTHPAARVEQTFPHVPCNAGEDVDVVIYPRAAGAYALSPYPFAADGAEFAFAGRPIAPGGGTNGSWAAVLRQTPTVWETFRLVAG
jgi:hypothetical protein